MSHRLGPLGLLAATLLAVPLGLSAAEDPAPEGTTIPLGTSITVHSALLDEDRELLVHTPPGYDRGDGRYPVLYVLDGEYTFPFTVGIADFLAKSSHAPEMLVVGIVNTDRTRDLTPEPGPRERERYGSSGGAARFLRVLEEEIVPFVEGHYRTGPFRVLVGHSQGGLFTVHALLEGAPFGGFVAASPSVFWNDRMPAQRIRQGRPEGRGALRSLYFSMGDERDEMVGGADALAAALESTTPPGLTWTYRRMAGKDHEDMPLQSFYDGLDFVFRDTWDPSPITEIGFAAYAERLRAEYGDDFALPARTLFNAAPRARRRSCEDMAAFMGYWYEHRPDFFRRFLDDWVDEGRERLDQGEATCAAGMFELLVTAAPSEVEAHVGLGDAHRAGGDRGAALAAYREALALAPGRTDLRSRVDELQGSERH